jgi:1-acyl-sn-glycerol-3-phosphate acyltransferase
VGLACHNPAVAAGVHLEPEAGPRRPLGAWRVRRGAAPPHEAVDLADAERDSNRSPARDKALVSLPQDLRAHLPGVEPERRLTDWGRSERVEGFVDRMLADFLYHLWFRCTVEGVENVPSSGGALLVANHSGALPPDAAMIAKAIREEHAHPRPLHITVEHFNGFPGVSMLLPKLGCVAAHPANVQRLLYDEEALVLMFPEGRSGNRKLFTNRYRLRRFGRGDFVVSALRAGVPIVPTCVVGAEEAAPTFAHVHLLRRLTGLLYLPFTPTFPHLGPLGVTAYLPAKFRIRFLEPVELGAGLDERGAVQTATEEVRARVQENLFEMVGERKSVWLDA